MTDHAHPPDPLTPVAQPDGDVSAMATPSQAPAVAPDPLHPLSVTQTRPSTNTAPATSAAAEEILAVAVFEPLQGMEAQALATVRELSAALARGGYSRDRLYREPGGTYVLVRYWKSDAARRHAPEDPDAQRCWARLAQEIQIIKIYERLEEI